VNGSLRCEHRASPDKPVDPGAIVFASVWALACSGQGRAAATLQDALLRTLEDGIHSRALSPLHPYSKAVRPEQMMEAIAGRIGQSPRQLRGIAFPTASRGIQLKAAF
jgi:isocitrate dehydrogenase